MHTWRYITVILAVPLACTQWVSAGTQAATKSGRDLTVRFESHLSINSLKYAPIPQSALPAGCESLRPPQPIATASPLIDSWGTARAVSVSFIIGTDGLVHSAFVLTSAGTTRDEAVLKAVTSWRYRPALCNGVPAEAEARIDFSPSPIIFSLK